MSIWICKNCGQIYDDLYNADEICDECFEKLKREEKKQKRRNTPFFRFLSFVLALSLMLCIFSGFGVAHAEETTTEIVNSQIESNGTYMGYDVFSFNIGDIISNTVLIEYGQQIYETSGEYATAFYLMDFDESGNPHFYSHSQFGYFGYFELITDLNYRRFVGFNGGLSDKIDTAYFECTANYSYSVEGQSYNFKDYDDLVFTEGKTIAFSYTDGSSGFTGFLGNEKYLVAVPCTDNKATTMQTALASLKYGNYSDNFVVKEKRTYSAKFHSFSSLNDGETGLNMIDWLGMGKQYPLADFSINDNGNNHSYSLRISTNNKYVDICMNMWQDYKNNHITSTAGNVVGALATIKTLLTGAGSTAYGPLGLFLITVPMDNSTVEAFRKIAQRQFLENINNLSYVVEYNLTNSDLQFNEGESSARAYSVCLVDYLTITKGLVYRLDIVDNNTGFILDTAYFCNDTTFAKTNTGYGTKVYNYSSYDDLVNDVEKGNNYSGADNFSQSDTLHSDNPNDIVNWDKYNQYDFTNIQNLTGTLNSATAGLGGFFMACYNIIPTAFVSILLGTFTLVIILRVLGR